MAQNQPVTRSTRGASKHRRDLINTEIEKLKDLLPLSETIRQRLFQLQVMSLVCIFVRKERYLPRLLTPSYGNNFKVNSYNDFDYDVCKALRGFLLMVTRQGKLLYLSENAADYLAHSVEEIMSQGDSFYDLVDQRDHVTVQSELLSGPPTFALYPDRRVFMCRMNVCRTARRHPQYHKFVFIYGHYLHPIEYCNLVITQNNVVHPVFAAYCCPLITPENAEILAPGNTNVFCSWHSLDLKFLDADELALFHLAYEIEDLLEKSLYALLHPSDLSTMSTKHKLLSEDKESGCMLLLRLKTGLNEFTWVHLTMKLKDIAREDQSVQMIAATYQILSDIERATLQANKWIYSTPHRFQTVDQSDLSLYNGSKTADVVNGQSYVVDPTSDFCCVSVSAPLFDPAAAHLMTTAVSDPTATTTKPRRKYSTYKAKKTAQKKVNDPDTKREIQKKSNDHKQKSSKIVQESQKKLNSKKRFSLTSGLSPPTSADSTEEDHHSLSKIKSISVHIPRCHLPVPDSLSNASLVLTPEISPYDEKGPQNQKSTNGQHRHQNSHSLPSLSDKNYSITTNNTADPILGSVTHGYLPVLEPLSLEAYLQTVEAENCLPVFGAGGASFEDDMLSLCSLPSDETTELLPHLRSGDFAAKSPSTANVSQKNIESDNLPQQIDLSSTKIEPNHNWHHFPNHHHHHHGYFSWCNNQTAITKNLIAGNRDDDFFSKNDFRNICSVSDLDSRRRKIAKTAIAAVTVGRSSNGKKRKTES